MRFGKGGTEFSVHFGKGLLAHLTAVAVALLALNGEVTAALAAEVRLYPLAVLGLGIHVLGKQAGHIKDKRHGAIAEIGVDPRRRLAGEMINPEVVIPTDIVVFL